MDRGKCHEHHEAVVELMGYSDELVFRLEEHQEVDVLRLHLRFTVDANQKPHAHHVDENMNIRHEVLVDG